MSERDEGEVSGLQKREYLTNGNYRILFCFLRKKIIMKTKLLYYWKEKIMCMLLLWTMAGANKVIKLLHKYFIVNFFHWVQIKLKVSTEFFCLRLRIYKYGEFCYMDTFLKTKSKSPNSFIQAKDGKEKSDSG